MNSSVVTPTGKKRERKNRKDTVTLTKERLDSRLFVYERSKADTIWGCVYRLDVKGLYDKLKVMRKVDRVLFCHSEEKSTGLKPSEVASQGFCAKVVRGECSQDLCKTFAKIISILSSAETDEIVDFTTTDD